METTHSKNRRTKSATPKIVVNNWDDIWQSFKEANETVTIEEMNSQGWKTVEQTAKLSGLSRARINQMGIDGEVFDREVKKVVVSGRAREINFLRPKV